MVEKTKKAAQRKQTAERTVRHPEFGKILDDWMVRTGAENIEIARYIGDKNGEKIRRYRNGESMPRSKTKLQLLADLIGISTAELRGEGSPHVLQSMMGPDTQASNEDEHRLLKAYRKMKPLGQKAIRAHAGRLLEQQGLPDKDNPFGKGGLN